MTSERKTGQLFSTPKIVNYNVGFKRKRLISTLNKAWADFRRVFLACLLSLQMLTGKVTQKIAQSAMVVASVSTYAPCASQCYYLPQICEAITDTEIGHHASIFVSNSGGAPYLQEDVQSGNPNQRIVVYFMSSEDANDYLNEMAQGSPSNINEFRITAVSMEKIVNKIQARKQSRKLRKIPYAEYFTYPALLPTVQQCGENCVI